MQKTIDKEYKHEFQVLKDGLNVIEITARCKNWWQNKSKLFDDDDLRVEIDGIKFPKLYPKKRGLFNSPADWNGNKLKNLSQTNFFIIFFQKGQHSLHFFSDQKPVLEKIDIYEFSSDSLIKKGFQAEEGNGRPWCAFILINLSLKGLSITASVQEGKAHEENKKDDDDLKLIIDGQIQKNDTPASHEHWYWCGQVLKGEPMTFSKKTNLDSSIHYIELWADRAPVLQKVVLDLGKIDFKRIPTVDDTNWTGDFNDDTEQMILARLIFGEARSVSNKARIAVGWSIRNRVESSHWANTYHGVILKEDQYSAFRRGDKNRPFVENPFRDKDQIDAWYECYKIAEQVMRGEVDDPTGGANHYYDDSIDPPYWTKSKQAEFKIKIDNLFFYYLDFSKSAKIYGKIVLFVGFIVLTAGAVVWGLENNNYIDFEPIVKGVLSQGTYQLTIQDNEVFQISHNTGAETQLTNDGFPKCCLIFSPTEKKIGYFQDLYRADGEIDTNDPEAVRNYYDNYTSLRVVNVDGSESKEIYRGNYKTSNWEWLSDEEVVVYVGCGTECKVAYIIDANTGERKFELQYGVGHEWSPNKELVLAYNYSGRYGVMVGDKKGNEVFSIRRENQTYYGLVFSTKAAWSPDSSKIAVIIKKENQEVMELLVFDAKEDFKQIFQSDVGFFEDMELVWSDDSQKVTLNNLEVSL